MRTAIINTKIGESRNVARIWIEGAHLQHGGLVIGTKYAITHKSDNRVELTPANDDQNDQTFTVSKREKYGVIKPLMEIRTDLLKSIFNGIHKVRVAIKNGKILITANFIELRVRERLTRFREAMKKKAALKVCSLFHGAGILDRSVHSGMMRNGVNSYVQVGVELEAKYLDASIRNNKEIWREDSIAICSDVRDINFQSGVPQCDVLCAGIPCIGASRSGISRNKLAFAEEHDTAGSLFFDTLEAIKVFNPFSVIIENVEDYLKTASMAVIRSVLQSLGYQLHETVANGTDFGTLENRKRMILVAVTIGAPAEFSFEGMVSVKQKEARIADILEGVPLDSPRYKAYEYLAEKEIRDKAAKKGFMRQLLTGEESYCGVIAKGYAKSRSTEPFFVNPLFPHLSRLFTKLEHCRIKGIPPHVIDGLSETTAHEVLGQSVCGPVFDALGAHLALYYKRCSASWESSNEEGWAQPAPLQLKAA